MFASMKQPPAPPRKKRVWRISADAPLGRFVDLDVEEEARTASQPREPVEHIEPGWRQSSFDLAYGLEVRDDDDTVPGELIDELLKPRK